MLLPVRSVVFRTILDRISRISERNFEGIAAGGEVSFDLHADLVYIDAHFTKHRDVYAVFFGNTPVKPRNRVVPFSRE